MNTERSTTDYGWTTQTKQHPGELEILVEHPKTKGEREPLAIQIRVSRAGSVTVGAVTNQLKPNAR